MLLKGVSQSLINPGPRRPPKYTIAFQCLCAVEFTGVSLWKACNLRPERNEDEQIFFICMQFAPKLKLKTEEKQTDCPFFSPTSLPYDFLYPVKDRVVSVLPSVPEGWGLWSLPLPTTVFSNQKSQLVPSQPASVTAILFLYFWLFLLSLAVKLSARNIKCILR